MALTLTADPLLRIRLVLVPTVLAMLADHRRGSHRLRGSPRVNRTGPLYFRRLAFAICHLSFAICNRICHLSSVIWNLSSPNLPFAMKTYRSTFALVGLFFAGLLLLWWLESAGVPTESQRRERMEHILPELLDRPETDITRIEITRDGETLAFERRGKVRWQMTEPVDAAADASNLETFLRNLKGLRRSPDTGTIKGPAESYGLTPPAAVVKLFGSPTSSAEKTPGPLAVLEVGKTVHDFCYVRPAGRGNRGRE